MKLNSFAAMFAGMTALFGGESVAWVTTCLQQADDIRATIATREQETGERLDANEDGFWFAADDWRAAYRPYVVKNGVLQIPVKGVLLHDFPYAMGGWATGYDYIWRAYQRGMGDLNVKGIALIVHSPGGMVAGCFECVDRMATLRGKKPVEAFVSEGAYSAAYALVSVADKINVTRTGGVGSVGVVRLHVDWSKWNERAGLTYTYVHKGKHKVDGNPEEPLGADVEARWLDQMELPYSIFVTTVAQYRGLDEQAVRDTEALCYTAPEALSLGLVDKVGAFDDSLADFSASLNLNEGDETMADYSQAQFDEAVAAARAEGMTAGKAAGVTEGAAAMQARISAILDSEEAATRPAAARMLAFDTDKDAESARASLAKLPEEAKAAAPAPKDDAAAGAGAPKGMFAAAMDKTPQPNISADDSEKDNAKGVDPKSLRSLAASVGLKGYAKAN